MQATFSSKCENSANVTAAEVRLFYEHHTYPNYPILAKPLWQDGYLTSSLFAHRLGNISAPRGPHSTLIVGAGEILPYVIRKWEPRTHLVTALDASAASLRRAKIRCARTSKKVAFVQSDLEEYLSSTAQGSPRHFDHIDAFGVLHHLPNPLHALRQIAEVLKGHGTMRVMVYNSVSRSWIHEIQGIFRILGMSFHDPQDLKQAKAFLELAAQVIPSLRNRLQQMGPSLLGNAARFADTFMHPREARIGAGSWLATAESAGLTLIGLFDRYGELDHLRNTLWAAPTQKQVIEAIDHGEFEGNLELFFRKGGPRSRNSGTEAVLSPPWSLLTKPSPQNWWSFSETQRVSATSRGQIWANFVWHLHRPLTRVARLSVDNWILRHPLATSQRLARLGAILPGMIQKEDLVERLLAPMETLTSQGMQNQNIETSVTPTELHRLANQMVETRHLPSRYAAVVAARLGRLNSPLQI